MELHALPMAQPAPPLPAVFFRPIAGHERSLHAFPRHPVPLVIRAVWVCAAPLPCFDIAESCSTSGIYWEMSLA